MAVEAQRSGSSSYADPGGGEVSSHHQASTPALCLAVSSPKLGCGGARLLALVRAAGVQQGRLQNHGSLRGGGDGFG